MVLHFFVLLFWFVLWISEFLPLSMWVGGLGRWLVLLVMYQPVIFFLHLYFLISEYQKKKVYFETSCIISTPGLMQQTKTKIITFKNFFSDIIEIFFFNQFTPPRFTLSITGINLPCLIKSYVSPGLYYITLRCLLNLHNRDLSKIKYFF